MTRTETWADLFARAEGYDVSESDVNEGLGRRRQGEGEGREGADDDGGETDA